MSSGMVTAKFDGGPYHGQTMRVPDLEWIQFPHAESTEMIPLHKMDARAKDQTYKIIRYRRSLRMPCSVPGGAVVYYFQD